MTFLAWWIRAKTPRRPPAQPPRIAKELAPRLSEISIVVPVRNNALGIQRLVGWWEGLPRRERAREVIIVDDGSDDAVRCPSSDGVRVIRNATCRGPAAARNTGWRSTTGNWIAFTDSDCLPQPGWPESFRLRWDGEVAIQGDVRALGGDLFSRFYDGQQILRPMAWSEDGRPKYLISANALVLRQALETVGGFSERFPFAAGEDVDLGLRVAEVGLLRWSSDAAVAHDFEPDLRSFMRRFVRYGRGNRMLVCAGRPDLENEFRPRPFLARSGEPLHHLLAGVAFVSLLAGWLAEAVKAGD